MIVGIVFVESGQRRIPVQFAKRVVGRRMYGGQSTYIPLKVNQSGVIPVIFASSILAFPALIASALGTTATGVQEWINDNLVNQPGLVVHRLLHVADHLLLVLLHGDRVQPRAAGRHHPQAGWVHPGHPARDRRPSGTSPRCSTASRCRARCSSLIIAVTPLLVFAFWDISQFPFGGTALLITVGVALETMKQIDSQLMMRNYEGFLA